MCPCRVGQGIEWVHLLVKVGVGIDVAWLTWRVAIGACVVGEWFEGTFRLVGGWAELGSSTFASKFCSSKN